MPKTKDEVIVPDLKAVALDNTEYWEGPLPKKAGKIYSIYIYDENWRVHACSFRAMYELWWVDVITKNRLGDQDQQELYHHATEMDVTYAATLNIDVLKEKTFPDGMFFEERHKHYMSPPEKEWRDLLGRKKNEQEAHNELMLHAVQAYCENPLF